MIVEQVVAQYFGTNCWIFAPSANSECFLVDPGIAIPNLLPDIKEVLDRHNLKPIATLVTHGHLDHTFSVVPVDDTYGVATYIHPKDRPYLAHPYGILTAGGPLEALLAELGTTEFSEPKDVRELSDGTVFELLGMRIKALHGPGHTPGSTLFQVDDEYLISGDVLFQNSIGKTSLPQGSISDMKKTIQKVILPLPDELIVLPGHGPETTIGRERRNNEFLQQNFLRSAD